jgi:hypothetical protein
MQIYFVVVWVCGPIIMLNVVIATVLQHFQETVAAEVASVDPVLLTGVYASRFHVQFDFHSLGISEIETARVVVRKRNSR